MKNDVNHQWMPLIGLSFVLTILGIILKFGNFIFNILVALPVFRICSVIFVICLFEAIRFSMQHNTSPDNKIWLSILAFPTIGFVTIKFL